MSYIRPRTTSSWGPAWGRSKAWRLGVREGSSTHYSHRNFPKRVRNSKEINHRREAYSNFILIKWYPIVISKGSYRKTKSCMFEDSSALFFLDGTATSRDKSMSHHEPTGPPRTRITRRRVSASLDIPGGRAGKEFFRPCATTLPLPKLGGRREMRSVHFQCLISMLKNSKILTVRMFFLGLLHLLLRSVS